MSSSTESATLKMVPCGKCGGNIFIPSTLKPFETTSCKKCGHPVMIPMRLRQFELRSIIASGGMGTVYRAHDMLLHREVAVKLMKRELVNDAELVESFAREARACASLNHTNIIHIYEFDEHEGEKFIVMELSDCGSLEDRIEQDGQVDELQVLDVGVAVAEGLRSALKHNLLHLDIKPANILFNADNEPKLVDFGLASTGGERREEEGVMGTPEYIAPERVEQKGESFLSDMYSLAATLYNALTGQVPFSGEDPTAIALAHTNVPLTPPNQLVQLTDATNEALVRAMAKDPDERYQSYDEFIMALESARSHLLVQRFRSGR
jgi:eukaryotic-like serine/threonine-protein kinase